MQKDKTIDRLTIASNRLPIVLTIGKKDNWQVEFSTGGLVTALRSVLHEKKGQWIGWPGVVENIDLNELLAKAGQNPGYTLRPVFLTKKEINQYYCGFCNEIMWPLFHDLQSRCNFEPAYWDMYKIVNRKFARVIAESAEGNDFVWIHDYHLMLVAKELHQMGLKNSIGYFLHTPFPSPDICIKLPWRMQMLEAMLEYDLLGFQTSRDRNNFLHCVQTMLRVPHLDTRKQVSTIKIGKREIMAGIFPIGIDFQEFARQATSNVTEEHVRQLQEAMQNRQIILGVDRLDYSKGIPERLRAFRNALERFSSLRGNVVMVQIVVPSREDIPEYQSLRNEIEGLVSEINGKFTQPGWVPINYIFRSLDRAELISYYRAADIALVTPLKDGMNLVSKEYCAANVGMNGVLILSEFAGAASQLSRNSLLVNPYDVKGLADAIHRAYHMSLDERKMRMQRLRKAVARRDVFWWANSFLQTLVVKDDN